ncbi:MAG: hypothetical protein NC397_10160 [Clostridium sp.]|nr:hypothetical protein [Clostridium sp.]
MKKISKSVAVIMAVVLLVLSFAGCAKISYVTNGAVNAIQKINDGSWKDSEETVQSVGENVVSIEPFKAGTYGSIEFKTEADVVNYYVECYNNTKAQTASYVDKDGNESEFYALVGEETLEIDNILIDGSRNEMLNNVVPGIVKGAFAKGIYGLPPSNNRDPLLDNENMDADNPGNYDFRKSYFTPEYCLACNVTENDNGTITIVIQPKDASMAARGADAQGSFFEVLKDLGGTVAGIFNDYDMLSWASGTTEENCVVNYQGGTGEITIDPKTNMVVSADYHMNVFVEVNHANVTVIKDKSGAIYISHYIHYPASDSYLMESKGLTRK